MHRGTEDGKQVALVSQREQAMMLGGNGGGPTVASGGTGNAGNSNGNMSSQSRCYLCETPKRAYSLIRSFSEIVCRGCVNYEGPDRVEQLIVNARKFKASQETIDLSCCSSSLDSPAAAAEVHHRQQSAMGQQHLLRTPFGFYHSNEAQNQSFEAHLARAAASQQANQQAAIHRLKQVSPQRPSGLANANQPQAASAQHYEPALVLPPQSAPPLPPAVQANERRQPSGVNASLGSPAVEPVKADATPPASCKLFERPGLVVNNSSSSDVGERPHSNKHQSASFRQLQHQGSQAAANPFLSTSSSCSSASSSSSYQIVCSPTIATQANSVSEQSVSTTTTRPNSAYINHHHHHHHLSSPPAATSNGQRPAQPSLRADGSPTASTQHRPPPATGGPHHNQKQASSSNIQPATSAASGAFQQQLPLPLMMRDLNPCDPSNLAAGGSTLRNPALPASYQMPPGARPIRDQQQQSEHNSTQHLATASGSGQHRPVGAPLAPPLAVWAGGRPPPASAAAAANLYSASQSHQQSSAPAFSSLVSPYSPFQYSGAAAAALAAAYYNIPTNPLHAAAAAAYHQQQNQQLLTGGHAGAAHQQQSSAPADLVAASSSARLAAAASAAAATAAANLRAIFSACNVATDPGRLKQQQHHSNSEQAQAAYAGELAGNSNQQQHHEINQSHYQSQVEQNLRRLMGGDMGLNVHQYADALLRQQQHHYQQQYNNHHQTDIHHHQQQQQHASQVLSQLQQHLCNSSLPLAPSAYPLPAPNSSELAGDNTLFPMKASRKSPPISVVGDEDHRHQAGSGSSGGSCGGANKAKQSYCLPSPPLKRQAMAGAAAPTTVTPAGDDPRLLTSTPPGAGTIKAAAKDPASGRRVAGGVGAGQRSASSKSILDEVFIGDDSPSAQHPTTVAARGQQQHRPAASHSQPPPVSNGGANNNTDVKDHHPQHDNSLVNSNAHRPMMASASLPPQSPRRQAAPASVGIEKNNCSAVGNNNRQPAAVPAEPTTGRPAGNHQFDALKCLICCERLEDRHFVQCPSVVTHKFCFACSKESIEQQRIESRTDSFKGDEKIFCPSGKWCLLANERSPWTFMNSEIETIFRESSRPSLKALPTPHDRQYPAADRGEPHRNRDKLGAKDHFEGEERATTATGAAGLKATPTPTTTKTIPATTVPPHSGDSNNNNINKTLQAAKQQPSLSGSNSSSGSSSTTQTPSAKTQPNATGHNNNISAH